MTKYHRSKDGIIRPCKAGEGACPVGGEHFDSMEEGESKREGILSFLYNPQPQRRVGIPDGRAHRNFGKLGQNVEKYQPFAIDDNGSHVESEYAHEYVDPLISYADGRLESPNNNYIPIDGFSHARDYDGPIMHPTEELCGKMECYVREHPGTYAVTEVDDEYGNTIGWALMKRYGSDYDRPLH